MIPITNNTTRRVHSGSYVPEYVRRIFHYPQMDLEYTFWMMFYLCVNPKVVYRTTTWHKRMIFYICIFNTFVLYLSYDLSTHCFALITGYFISPFKESITNDYTHYTCAPAIKL